jgi:Flp pilus assembly protein TadG
VSDVDRPRRERGSSLMLMPVAVLVFIILGAFAVDFSAARLARREMISAAQGAAQDAAIAGLDEGAFYDDGTIRFDEREARAQAAASLAVADPTLEMVGFDIDDGAVVVTVAADVPTIFAKAVPGGPDTIRAQAQASARLEQ